MSLAPC